MMEDKNKSRFGELHNVCFNEENYPYDIFNLLKPFRHKQFRETTIRQLGLDNSPDDCLEYQNIANEVIQRFEKNISPIESKKYNETAISFFSNPYIGNWYLKEINNDSIIGYYNSIPYSGSSLWQESSYNLKYKESEIVYCIMQKLSKYYKQNNRFEVEFNKYKSFFSGTLAEFLECLINEYENFYYSTNLGFNYYYMNKIDGYDGLKDRLTEMVNNFSTPDQAEESEKVEQPLIIKDEVNGNPCIEFDNLFGADIARKNEVWQYMKLLGMIDNEGNYLLKSDRAIIRAFAMVMKKNGRFAPTANEGFLIRVLGLKLLADNNIRVRKSKQIDDKQKEIVTFLNNQENKNNVFVNVD